MAIKLVWNSFWSAAFKTDVHKISSIQPVFVVMFMEILAQNLPFHFLFFIADAAKEPEATERSQQI